ncbi:hypothetical protein G6011_09512 [Alternaria panax]|uniref:Uncharacterized protein n=1 Tax=Alternaria panax TaxID=48097 RepID=A0AAD4NQ56_9PLEO|nr:hypothetical protein G6011_09512 [Alternaria panax]
MQQQTEQEQDHKRYLGRFRKKGSNRLSDDQRANIKGGASNLSNILSSSSSTVHPHTPNPPAYFQLFSKNIIYPPKCAPLPSSPPSSRWLPSRLPPPSTLKPSLRSLLLLKRANAPTPAPSKDTNNSFAIVNGARVNFGGTAINLPSNIGRNADIPNLLPGTSCVLTVVPACACANWSVVATRNCGSSRSVSFS